MRNWILEANQAGNLIKQENLSGMKDFLVDIGSNRRVAAGMLLAEFKIPWRDLAETGARARAFGAGEVNSSSNSLWWDYTTLLEHFLNGIDRLRFAPAERSGAVEFPPVSFRHALAGTAGNFDGDYTFELPLTKLFIS